MKNLKFGIIGAGLLGIISIFLPWIDMMGIKITLWDARSAAGADFWMVALGFLAPLAMGVMGVVKAPMQKWQFGVSAGGFAIALIKVRNAFDLAIGAKLMLIAAIAGLAISILLIVKGEEG